MRCSCANLGDGNIVILASILHDAGEVDEELAVLRLDRIGSHTHLGSLEHPIVVPTQDMPVEEGLGVCHHLATHRGVSHQIPVGVAVGGEVEFHVLAQ